MKNISGKTLAFVALLFWGVMFAVTAKGDLPNTSGSAVRGLYDVVTGRNSRFRLDATNNQFVFGSSIPVVGSVLTVFGQSVAKSSSTTATYKPLRVLNAAGVEIMSVQQNGIVQVPGTVNAGNFTGDGSTLSGVTASSGTNTWTQPQYHSSSVNLSSGTASVLNIGAGGVTNSGSLVVAVNSTETVNGALVANGSATLNGLTTINAPVANNNSETFSTGASLDITAASVPGVLHQFGGNASTAAFVAVTSYTFGNANLWVASTTYVCHFKMILTGAGDIVVLRIANDSGTNYFWGASAIDQGIPVSGQSNGDFANGFPMQSINQSGIKANGSVLGNVSFETNHGSSVAVTAMWNSVMEVSSTRQQSFVGGGGYTGGATFTSPTFVLLSSLGGSPAGTMRGSIKCMRQD